MNILNQTMLYLQILRVGWFVTGTDILRHLRFRQGVVDIPNIRQLNDILFYKKTRTGESVFRYKVDPSTDPPTL